MSSYATFRLHRLVRRLQRQVRTLRPWLRNYLHRHIYGAWQKLGTSRWTFVSWIGIVLLTGWGLRNDIMRLDAFYKTEVPQVGGIYREGVVGKVRVVNPILLENSASRDVSRLVFSGLTKVNQKRQIESDLAQSWDLAADQKTYTFKLRKDVVWHDGVPLTAADVAFTISAIQNPDTRSSLNANWQGVKYEVVDDATIKLVLPNPYPAFINETTVGILPKHILETTRPSSLRLSEFNQRPIGTGPFKLSPLVEGAGSIKLSANQRYYGGKPRLDGVEIIVYQKQSDMLAGYSRKQIDGVSQIGASDVATADKIDDLRVTQLAQPAYVGVFFNLKSPALADIAARRALASATDRKTIIEQALAGQATEVYQPLLPGFVGYNPQAVKYKYNLEAAKTFLAQSSIAKAKEKPTLFLVTLNDPQLLKVADLIKQQWGALGIAIDIKAADTIELQQDYIRSRNYDLLLFGQNLGIDSDIYSFWHSSQVADPGLNVSVYSNADADKALESGRLARDPKNRANKYATFESIWAGDQPAVLLYSPYYIYGQATKLSGLQANRIAEPADRFYGIEKWSVRSREILKKDLYK